MQYNVSIAGATGAVGKEFIDLLQARNFPIGNIRFLASANSAGKTLEWKGRGIAVETLGHDSFENTDIVFFSAGASRSKEFAPSAVKAGALVIDNSSAFRMEKDVPLVVPECNPEDAFEHRGIISNPNCSTIQMVVALKPIQDEFGISRINVATYQAVSGSGVKAVEELKSQISGYAANEPISHSVYPSQILLNAIPHVDVFLDGGYTMEEMKMVNETRKILHDPSLKISATCVRIPVVRCHSEAIQVETKKPVDRDAAIRAFQNAPGVAVKDQPEPNGYPMPLFAEKDELTWVGRIRKDISLENGLSFWCVADQLYKGAALNSIQIAESMLEQIRAGKASSLKPSL